MHQEADSKNMDIKVEAFPESKMSDKAKEADVILLSPQIRYLEKDVRSKYSDKIVYVIEMTDYIPTKIG